MRIFSDFIPYTAPPVFFSPSQNGIRGVCHWIVSPMNGHHGQYVVLVEREANDDADRPET